LGGKGLANFLKFQNLSFLGMRTNLWVEIKWSGDDNDNAAEEVIMDA